MKLHITSIFFSACVFFLFFFTGFAVAFLFMMKTNEVNPFYAFITGILFMIPSILCRKILLKFLYSNTVVQIVFYLFYMTCIFGFFMGVPVFNIIPGFMYALLTKEKINFFSPDKSSMKRCVVLMYTITIIGLLLFCSASVFIALKDPYTGQNLQGMMRLKNEPDFEVILSIIIFGGLFLLALQLFVEKKITSSIQNCFLK